MLCWNELDIRTTGQAGQARWRPRCQLPAVAPGDRRLERTVDAGVELPLPGSLLAWEGVCSKTTVTLARNFSQLPRFFLLGASVTRKSAIPGLVRIRKAVETAAAVAAVAAAAAEAAAAAGSENRGPPVPCASNAARNATRPSHQQSACTVYALSIPIQGLVAPL